MPIVPHRHPLVELVRITHALVEPVETPAHTVSGIVQDDAMTNESRWVGLLRAVNVGGRTLTNAQLKAAAADAGFTAVATLLASGNLVFTATGDEPIVRSSLEQVIAADAGFTVEVLLRSKPQLQRLIEANPFPDGAPSHVLVCFLSDAAPSACAERLAEVAVNERIQVGEREVWIDFVDGIGRSRLAAKLPALVKPLVVTGRNLNTVVKLEALL